MIKENKMNLRKVLGKVLSALTILCLLGTVLVSCAQEEGNPEITEFSFVRGTNSSVTKLEKTVFGTVDSKTRVIKVLLPQELYTDSAERALLKPSIQVSDGATLTKTASLDFSKSPVTISVSEKGKTVTYSVQICAQPQKVSKGALLFTEYYSGRAAPYKGENNQYIEIRNCWEGEIDLSSVVLTRHVWENGSRQPEKDQSVNLSGTLEPNGMLVIYSQRCKWFKEKKDENKKLWQSDSLYNSIITTDGEDGFTLTNCEGTFLDALGPANGEGTGWNWGASKNLQRKLTFIEAPSLSKGWSENEWITTIVTNDSDEAETAGEKTKNPDDNAKPGEKSKDITYFALEGLSTVVYGTIDNAERTVAVSLSDEVDVIQKLTVSTNGQKIRYNGKDVVSGETVVNFSRPFTLVVFDNDGERVDYTVNCERVHYNFSSALAGNYENRKALPKDGDVVLIYAPTFKMVLGTSAQNKKLQGVSKEDESGIIEYSNEMAGLCVSIDKNGYYTFTCNGKYLAHTAYSGKTSPLSFESAPGKYTQWKIEEVSKDSGIFYIYSVNALQGSDKMALEYYGGSFCTYRLQNSNYYKFNFFIRKD